MPLSQIKKYNPLYIARYAVDNQISGEPAFDWWAQELLRRALQMICSANSKKKHMYNMIGFKYGIQVPRTFSKSL